MTKRLQRTSFLLLIVVLFEILTSCSPNDNLGGDLYTWSVYPSRAHIFKVGSSTYPYSEGWFDNVVGNVLTLSGVDYTSANMTGGGNVTSFNGRMGVVTSLQADYSAWFVPYIGATSNIDLNAKTVTNGVFDSVVGKGTWTASGVWKLPAMFFNGDITTDRWLSSPSNTFLGVGVAGTGNLAHTGASEGWDNTGIGNSALRDITTGYFNTAVGNLALASDTTGYFNSAFGTGTLLNLKDGYFNTGIGLEALAAEVSGDRNTALGMFAGYTTTGDDNVFLGYSAGKNELGSNTLYIDNSDTATPLIYGNFSTDNLTINGFLNMSTHQIHNVVDPTFAQDAATKNYVDLGMSGNLTGYVPKSLFDINTILKADADDTPLVLAVDQQTVVGRATGGNIKALSVAEQWAMLSNFAGMYRHESANVTVIQQVDDWHLVNDFTVAYLGGGWTFHTGEQLAITAYADNGDGRTRVTDAGHTLINGDIISISGTISYDGVWIVEQVAANTFVINTPWVADDGASVGEHGSHFHSATTTATGKYLVAYTLSVQPVVANSQVEVSLFYNATQEIASESQSRLEVAADSQIVAGFSIVDVTVNGVVSLGIRNLTDDGDFTIRDGNMTLVRIG